MNGVARRLALRSVALVLGVNAFVLGGVAYNRSGEPQARLILSERELLKPYEYMGASGEDSGRTLALEWRIPETDSDPGYHYAQVPWLDAERLRVLGFPDAALKWDATREHGVSASRQVWVVLELAGAAHEAALSKAQARVDAARESAAAAPANETAAAELENAIRQDVRERTRSTRLFAVDAGRDATALQARYPDRTRHLLLRASIAVGFDDQEAATPRVFGYIDRLYLADLHVPREYHAAVDAAAQDAYSNAPPRAGFEAIVHFGRRGEPWIVDLRAREPTLTR